MAISFHKRAILLPILDNIHEAYREYSSDAVNLLFYLLWLSD
jgi:hypothetical protein